MPPSRPQKVLVLGQIPPPYNGQAIMIQKLLEAEIDGVEWLHVPMRFSKDMKEIGRFSCRKVLHLAELLKAIHNLRRQHQIDTLYYPPAGPHRVPFYRDAAILIPLRRLFKHTIFHFHASGISTLHPHLNPMEKRLFSMAYSAPDVAIHTSALNPKDGQYLGAKHNLTIHCGLEDHGARWSQQQAERPQDQGPKILFVGALYPSKGVGVLVEAASILKERGAAFHIQFVGQWQSRAYQESIEAKIRQWDLSSHITFSGVLTGDAKWEAYATSDLLCFPTHYESESFGLVNIEAMQFALPVITTEWRGIPEVVSHEETGILVPPKEPRLLADALLQLLRRPELRRQYGHAGRERYLAKFTLAHWERQMAEAFSLCGTTDLD